MVLRHRAQRLELSLEQGLVDLALVDRDGLLHADLDHLLAIDPKLLRQLLRRQVVRHLLASLYPRKMLRIFRGAGLSQRFAWEPQKKLVGTSAKRAHRAAPILLSAGIKVPALPSNPS